MTKLFNEQGQLSDQGKIIFGQDLKNAVLKIFKTAVKNSEIQILSCLISNFVGNMAADMKEERVDSSFNSQKIKPPIISRADIVDEMYDILEELPLTSERAVGPGIYSNDSCRVKAVERLVKLWNKSSAIWDVQEVCDQVTSHSDIWTNEDLARIQKEVSELQSLFPLPSKPSNNSKSELINEALATVAGPNDVSDIDFWAKTAQKSKEANQIVIKQSSVKNLQLKCPFGIVHSAKRFGRGCAGCDAERDNSWDQDLLAQFLEGESIAEISARTRIIPDIVEKTLRQKLKEKLCY